MKKSAVLLPLIVLLVIAGYYLDLDFSDITTGAVIEPKINSYVADSGNIDVYFCPREDCAGALVSFMDTAKEYVHCAMFEIDHPLIQEELLKKSREIEVKIVTDNDYLKEFNHSFVKIDSWGLMHNKFCVIDGKRVSSGSMNPTTNGADKNNNNLLLIESKILTANYEAEFEEMWDGTYKKGNLVLNPNVDLVNIKVKNYFCPDDQCAEMVEEELKKAQESIYFMTFSFTHEEIGNMLALKKSEGLIVEGVMEARQVTKYSVYDFLIYNGIDVIKDGNKQNMHHKVFIIDEKTVVTGSFNPTAGGDTRNDENVLVIEDTTIAKRFMDEYRYVREVAEGKV